MSDPIHEPDNDRYGTHSSESSQAAPGERLAANRPVNHCSAMAALSSA